MCLLEILLKVFIIAFIKSQLFATFHKKSLSAAWRSLSRKKCLVLSFPISGDLHFKELVRLSFPILAS